MMLLLLLTVAPLSLTASTFHQTDFIGSNNFDLPYSAMVQQVDENFVSESAIAKTTIGAALPASGALSPEDSPALQQLKTRFAGDVMFRAELSHFFTDSFTEETSETYGTIWFARDRYRIETPDQIIVVNGNVSTVLNIRQNRVIISHYDAEEDEFAPSRFFASDNEAYSSSDVLNPDGSTVINITSDDPFELFQSVAIRVSRDGSPMQIDAVDQMDNQIRTTFRFGRFSDIDSDRFALTPPRGAEIVDLRD